MAIEMRYLGEFFPAEGGRDPFRTPGPVSNAAADLIVKLYHQQERLFPGSFRTIRCRNGKVYAEHATQDSRPARAAAASAAAFFRGLAQVADGVFRLPPRPKCKPVLIR